MGKGVAVVTGAGSGVGRAAALALLNDGWSVGLAGRRSDVLEETASMATAGTPLVVPTDVTMPEEVENLFATVTETFGRLDTLFNNAGGGAPSTNFGEVTYDTWLRVVEVNLNGMFLCANAAYRTMRDQSPQGGRIINNGSLSAHAPRPGSAPYTTTKHAITGLTKCIALDGRAHNIVCAQIDIGNAATPMTARMAGGVPQPNGTVVSEPTMDAANVGDTILLMANMDLSANMQSVMVMSSQMPFLGRG
ncbi:SDR family oxidoreductase [Parasedimentitalea psychrophila]|uniref:SDR family oxidoreductase n=1 Tax=Parasedimentitalea psychrophila TaxID=2997337 RepID=A0A9Y2L2V3_9RHOB|nr:SDR family oxidoreductase [Parasedimentitalea psychrophila]WIY26562.1 SDR family oxidoreductase [Parasedimentitalea psychrophila]